MPKYFDIHSHVQFNAFEQDKEEVIQRALENDTWMINVGTQLDTSRKAVELAEKYSEGVYAIIGLHPIHTTASYHDVKELGEGGKEFTSKGENFNYEEYKKLASHKKVVGIGECGLDYYRNEPESIEKQKEIFIQQIKLANEVNKPLMLHIRNGKHGGANSQRSDLKNSKRSDLGEFQRMTREGEVVNNAYLDAINILKKYAKVKGNIHFFAGSWEDAKNFLDFNFSLSFTGVITFTNDYDEIIKKIPLDMIMAETDCPYITPVPYRGKRNEPLYVSEVVKKIAEIKNLPEKEVAEQIIKNTQRVFLNQANQG